MWAAARIVFRFESRAVMQELREFVVRHAERGTCRCGRCIDHPGEDSQPAGHTGELVFRIDEKDLKLYPDHESRR